MRKPVREQCAWNKSHSVCGASKKLSAFVLSASPCLAYIPLKQSVNVSQDVCLCTCVCARTLVLVHFADVFKAQQRRSCALGFKVSSTHHCLHSLCFTLLKVAKNYGCSRRTPHVCVWWTEQYVNMHICVFMCISRGGCLFKSVYKCVYVHWKGL